MTKETPKAFLYGLCFALIFGFCGGLPQAAGRVGSRLL